MADPLTLETLSEKSLQHPADPSLIAYCPSMDLIALTTTDQQVLIYRLNGQPVYGAAQKAGQLKVESIRWKPNGSHPFSPSTPQTPPQENSKADQGTKRPTSRNSMERWLCSSNRRRKQQNRPSILNRRRSHRSHVHGLGFEPHGQELEERAQG